MPKPTDVSFACLNCGGSPRTCNCFHHNAIQSNAWIDSVFPVDMKSKLTAHDNALGWFNGEHYWRMGT